MEKDLNTIKERIEKIGKLPTFPTVALEIQRMTKDPDASMGKISTMIENDPSLTITLLKIANSPFYGFLQTVRTAQHALSVMGLKAVENLVTSICVFKTFDTIGNKQDFDKQAFYEHSTGCGAVARMIATRLGFIDNGDHFIAGLTHDLGKIILDFYFHDDFIKALEFAKTENIPLNKAEKEIIGADHAAIGSWLAKKWKLPDSLVESIAYHHEPSSATLDKPLTAIIHLANILCKVKNIGFGGSFDSVSFVENPAWQILAKEKPELLNLDIERLVIELDDEIEKSFELFSSTTTVS
jgi:HD-like signal output (HDOD) protein